jgi:hypothetical protein
MSIIQIIAILGTIPLFSLRTFLPAFLTALFLAYPQYFPGMENVAPAPGGTFLTRDWVIISLGTLSVLEIIGDKSSSIRNFVKTAETYLKPIIYLLINLSLIDDTSTEVLKDVQWAAFDPIFILLGFGTLMVYWLAGLRRDFLTFLEDMDEDDNLLIQTITSWVEDSLVLFGFILLIWAGIIMVIIYAAAIAFFVYIGKKHKKKLEQQKLSCPQCREKNLPFAVKCFNCKFSQPQVYKVGIFGQKKGALVTNVKDHRLYLAAHKRCPDCGNKLKSNSISQSCDLCENPIFQSPTIQDFIKSQDRKFYKITGLSFILGFIPVIGFIISAVMANIYLFSPYRRYISKGTSLLTKIFIKLITFIFFILGIALGFIAAPIYIIMRYMIWKKRFKARTMLPEKVY